MLRLIFNILASLISIYSLLCFISAICDPYLNCFRGIKWLRLGSFDFSPAIGLCLLGVVSFILSGISRAQTVSIALILSMVLSMAWNIVHSILILVIIIMAIRLIAIFVQKTEYSGGILGQLDSSIGPLVSRISHTFTGVCFFVIDLVGTLLITFLAQKIALLPF